MTLILPNLKNSDIAHLSCLFDDALMSLYFRDPEMLLVLERYIDEAGEISFLPLKDLPPFHGLKDRKVISTLNFTQNDFLWNGDALYDYMFEDVLLTERLNRAINDWQFAESENDWAKVDGRPASAMKRFKERLMEHEINNG